MAFETVILSKNREEHIATITLNRPQRLNALNDQMVKEFLSALSEVEKDPEIRVLIVTGAGRAFCAGADLKSGPEGERALTLEDGEEIRLSLRYGVQQIARALRRLEMPVIAMVNGDAVGAGFDWAMACDLRVGSEKARFAVAFTRVGLVPGMGGAWFLPRLMGLGKAAEYIFTGDFLEAREAERLGVLNKVVPPEDLEQETLELARKIANGPPIAIRLDKALLYQGLQTDLDTALDMAATTQSITIRSQDHKEGVAAFREKRKPVYKGR